MKYCCIFEVPGGLSPPPAALAQTSACQERKVCYFEPGQRRADRGQGIDIGQRT
jgi:hypothetical protein